MCQALCSITVCKTNNPSASYFYVIPLCCASTDYCGNSSGASFSCLCWVYRRYYCRILDPHYSTLSPIQLAFYAVTLM